MEIRGQSCLRYVKRGSPEQTNAPMLVETENNQQLGKMAGGQVSLEVLVSFEVQRAELFYSGTE